MAAPLGYTPPPRAETGADDELRDLVQALSASGLLRAAAGGARSYPRLLNVGLQQVDAGTLRSALALLGSLSDLDPQESQRLAAGIRQARSDAVAATQGPAEGPVALLKRLRHPDTRRGISAALAALTAIGAALPR